MTRFYLRKYSYVIVYLALILTVGLVWLLGRGEELPAPEASTPSTASSGLPGFLDETPAASAISAESGQMAGVWVPYMSLTADPPQAAFEENFKRIADTAREKGITALFVHVRPFCDALYPSQLYPWSHVLTGEQGGDPGFDPLAFMIDYAHQNGMELHAWINPLRVKTAQTPAALAPDNPYEELADDYPGYFMTAEDGGVYLNPAYPYVRTLVAQGAAEIARGYDVDGIHFDDYFYPVGGESLDAEAYAAYVASVETPLPVAQWRQANISALVQEVYQAIKAADPAVSFGISPQGNILNDLDMGADVAAWCAVPGYIDYICPQLYYSFENEALPFETALNDWLALPRHEDLQLYAGLALYKAGTDADGGTWLNADDILARQITLAAAKECSGVVFYSSDYLTAGEAEKELENAVAAMARLG